MLKIKRFSFNPIQECCCVAWKEAEKPVSEPGAEDDAEPLAEAVIIDPGFYDETEKSELFDFIETSHLKVRGVLLTHGHFDHIFGVKECVERYGAKVYMNQEDKIILQNDGLMAQSFGLKRPDVSFATENIKEGDRIAVGKMSFEVIETPGHTPGGVCFYDREDKVLFSGDTLFAGSIGRTDNPWGDYDKLIKSVMEKVMGLDGDTKVIPGHGPSTTISNEIANNPFLIPFNEPDIDWENADGLTIGGGEDVTGEGETSGR